MEFSHELIKDFISLSKTDDETTKNERAYGTIAQMADNSGTGVQLDGSQYVTPAARTTSFKIGDRVEVCITDHTAMVLGNYTDPSASSNKVDALNDAVNLQGSTISAINSNIDIMNSTIKANSSNIQILNTNINQVNTNIDQINTSIEQVNTDINEVNTKINTTNSNLEIADSKISVINSAFTIEDGVVTGLKGLDGLDFIKTKDLTTESLNSKYADINFANVNFANIDLAKMKEFYAESGIIGDAKIKDGQITGMLVGVEIQGDLIKGNTIVADKLVIKGDNGLYYKLNTDGVTVAKDQTDYNSLNGTIIKAKSITATQIAVSDLVAFDATIGGFKITEDSIHSTGKDNIDSGICGIYMDQLGQVAFGDANNCIKYYKDTDGSYKLSISAGSIMLGTSKKTSVENALTEAQDAVKSIQVGGRNLFFNSSFQDDSNKWAPRILSNGVESIFDLKFLTKKGKKCAHIHSSNLNERIIVAQNILDKVEPNTTYTFSGWVLTENIVKGTTDYFARFHIDGAYTNNGSLSFYMYGYDAEFTANSGEGNWEYLSYTFTTDKDKLGAAVSLSAYVYARDLTGDIYFCDLKLEKGNKATDWTPAPEDINDAIDNIDVGSTNIVNGTAEMLIGNNGYSDGNWRRGGSGTIETIDIIDSPISNIRSGVRLTCANETTQVGVCQDNVPLNSSDVYTLSCWAKSNSETGVTCRLQPYSGSGSDYSSSSTHIITNVWTKISYTSNKKPNTTGLYSGAYIHLYHAASGNYLDVCGIKLEKGNKATDWTPSIDDTSKQISDAKQTADDANDKADYAQAWIQKNEDHLLFVAADSEGNATHMIQDGTGWTFDFEDLDKRLNNNSTAINNDIKKLQEDLSNARGNITNIDTAVGELQSHGNYARITEMEIDGEIQSVVVLGSTDTDNKNSLVISRSKILFMFDGQIPAHITNSELHIGNAYIDDELSFGKCIWRVHQGNFGLSWED